MKPGQHLPNSSSSSRCFDSAFGKFFDIPESTAAEETCLARIHEARGCPPNLGACLDL